MSRAAGAAAIVGFAVVSMRSTLVATRLAGIAAAGKILALLTLTAGIAIGLVTIGGYELLIRLYVLSYFPLTAVAVFAAVKLRQRDRRPGRRAVRADGSAELARCRQQALPIPVNRRTSRSNWAARATALERR